MENTLICHNRVSMSLLLPLGRDLMSHSLVLGPLLLLLTPLKWLRKSSLRRNLCPTWGTGTKRTTPSTLRPRVDCTKPRVEGMAPGC